MKALSTSYLALSMGESCILDLSSFCGLVCKEVGGTIRSRPHDRYVDIDSTLLSDRANDAAFKCNKLELNNNDALFARIRNLNFGEIGPLLNRLARGVSDGYEERHQAQTVTQIKDYMKKLNRLRQEHKSLTTHVALAERIQQVIVRVCYIVCC